MVKVTREDLGFAARVVSFVAIFSFSSLRDPQIEPLLSTAIATRKILQLKSLRLDHHEPAETCLVHTPVLCFSSAPVIAEP